MARSTSTTRRQRTTARKTTSRRTRRPSTAHRGATVMRGRQRRVAEPGLQMFLERLASSLTSGDSGTAADCFEYPSAMVMSDPARYGPNHVFTDRSMAEQAFARAPEMYHQRGIQDTFPDIEEAQEIADGLLLVRTRFPYIDADGNDMGDGETSLYVVRRGPGQDYAICAAITLGADSDRADR